MKKKTRKSRAKSGKVTQKKRRLNSNVQKLPKELPLSVTRKRALKGDPIAQNNLGKAYDLGDGVEQDHAQSFHWFEKAAIQGYAEAQYGLGRAYGLGIGVEHDNVQAIAWCEKAAAKGYPAAQCQLGISYYDGEDVEQDYVQAIHWLEKSAALGYAAAQSRLGLAYASGDGVEQDYVQGIAWWKKAAVQGNAEGQCGLGLGHYFGRGIEENHLKAIHWLEKSAAQRYEPAQMLLAVLYLLEGEGVEPDRVQAIAWVEKAAAQGSDLAQYILGLAYANGDGVERDHNQAITWLEKAAAQGYEEAQEQLNVLLKTDLDGALGTDRKVLNFPIKADIDKLLRNQADQLFELIKPQLTAFAIERESTLIQKITSQGRVESGSSEHTPDILVSQEESLVHEYKASLRIPYPGWPEQETDEKGNSFFKSGGKIYKSRKELLQDLEESCLKTIVAFLNTKGGTLVIGVHDKDDKKTIVGIEREIGSKQNFLRSKDNYQLHLIQQINERIGTTFTSNYISIELPVIDGSTLCVVSCKEFRPAQNHGPAFLDDEKTYRRTGNRTDQVKGGKAISDFTLERQFIAD